MVKKKAGTMSKHVHGSNNRFDLYTSQQGSLHDYTDCDIIKLFIFVSFFVLFFVY